MKALAYLLLTQLKNRILILKQKPAMLILYLFVIVMIVFSVVMMIFAGNDPGKLSYADERIIYLAITGFGILYMVTFTFTGLSTGSSLFTMADVGLLFVAPISSKKILMYGLLSSIGKALLASFFILYQVGNLKISFGYGWKEIIALFFIYAVMVLFCQLLSISIYIVSNGNKIRKNMVKMVLYLLLGILILYVLFLQWQQRIGIMEAMFQTVDSSWFEYFPIAGWTVMFIKGVVAGVWGSTLLGFGLFLIVTIGMISLLTIGKADYYEDVLISTEFTYQMTQAAKEGRNPQRKSDKKIKVRDTRGFVLKGSGGNAILYKHLLEMKRENRFVFISKFTIFMSVAAGIAGYNLKVPGAIYIILAVFIYLLYFGTFMGKLKIELMKPYIYLIPISSAKKVLMASVTSILKPCVDAVFLFGVLAVVGSGDLPTCMFAALAYASAGALFVGITILYQRVLGGQPNAVIQMLIGIGLLVVILTPAVAASFLAAYLLPASLGFLCTLPFTVFCVLITVVLFLACGNLIDRSEYTGKA